MKLKQKLYKILKNNKFRIYRIPDFIKVIPQELQLVENDFVEELKEIRVDYLLFYNTLIHRYMVYKQYKDMIVHIKTLDGPNLEFRDLGDWLIADLRRGDLVQGKDFKKSVTSFSNRILEPSEAEKRITANNKLIQEQMNKDFDWYLRGRTSLDFGARLPHHKNLRKKKVTFIVGARTGKVLGKVVNGKLVKRYV